MTHHPRCYVSFVSKRAVCICGVRRAERAGVDTVTPSPDVRLSLGEWNHHWESLTAQHRRHATPTAE